MILFYSEHCQHCTLLLDTIKRHDTDNIIKLVSIDNLRSMKKPIDSKIHSVPALLFPKTKEIIFGKAVFDHLLLPNRGILFAKNIGKDKNNENNSLNNLNNNEIIEEPLAFSLGIISSDNYASVDDTDNNSLATNSSKNYRWTTISENGNKTENTNIEIPSKKINNNDKISNSLPSIEEIMQSREKDIR